ncbi:MAG: DUF1015 domain-containing protein [Candidatus Omnitrophica bacterium]|nr:DUF1015 domain-containing protein [Candidatus Omnitrophota bacterium]
MAAIEPFKGFRYNPARIKKLDTVVAPPYDVIAPRYRDSLYTKSPYNVIRLILGKETAHDTARDNKYNRAAGFFKTWIKGGVLAQDAEPCFYVYRQRYLHEGKIRTRLGFIGLMRIEDTSKKGILPHEHTLAKPKEDRLNLVKAVQANLSPIFSLYDDPSGVIAKLLRRVAGRDKPAADFEFETIRHTLWRMTDRAAVDTIRHRLAGEQVVIADGHHRYEVSRMYRNYLRERSLPLGNAGYVMMYFTDINHAENVTIFATHRLLKHCPPMDIGTIAGKLKPYFTVTTFTSLGALMKGLSYIKTRPAFGIYLGGARYMMAALKAGIDPARIMKGKQSPQWKRLDVAVLHELVIKKILSLSDSEDTIAYVRDARETAGLVRSGEYDIAFFLNPTRACQVKDVAERGDMMPQKSTYFYPKLVTGLVFNKF